MGKKMKFPFLSNTKTLDTKLPSSPPWPWPACANTNTLSFRASNPENDTSRTFNSAFLDTETTFTSSSRSFSTIISDDTTDPIGGVIQTLNSDRLFFEPEQSSSLLSTPFEGSNLELQHDDDDDDDDDENSKVACKETMMLSMDSNNPYQDFRLSMAEMIEAHGLKHDWQGLEELLSCYLEINGNHNHGFIVGAFIDLLVSLSLISTPTPTSTSTSSSSLPLSTSTSTSSSSLPLSTSTSTSSCPNNITNHNYNSSFVTTSSLSSSLDHGDNDNCHNDDNNDEHSSS